MKTFLIMIFILSDIHLNSILIHSVCNSNNRDVIGCVIFGEKYNRAQLAICMDERQLIEGSRTVSKCMKGKYCWYPCQMAAFGKADGRVSDLCLCVDGQKKSDVDSSCYLYRFGDCTWYEMCLKPKLENVLKCNRTVYNYVVKIGSKLCRAHETLFVDTPVGKTKRLLDFQKCLQAPLMSTLFAQTSRICHNLDYTFKSNSMRCFTSLAENWICDLPNDWFGYSRYKAYHTMKSAFQDVIGTEYDEKLYNSYWFWDYNDLPCDISTGNSLVKRLLISTKYTEDQQLAQTISNSVATSLSWQRKCIGYDAKLYHRPPKKDIIFIEISLFPISRFDAYTTNCNTEPDINYERNKVTDSLPSLEYVIQCTDGHECVKGEGFTQEDSDRICTAVGGYCSRDTTESCPGVYSSTINCRGGRKCCFQRGEDTTCLAIGGECIEDFQRCKRGSIVSAACSHGKHCCATYYIGKGCEGVQYQCFDGSCIPLRRFCDGIAHCQDASDELNCTNECLLRHDLYGKDEKLGYHGNRRITRDGEKCTSPCRGVDGRSVYCVTENNVTKPCDVPYCSLFTSWTRKTCEFTYSFCDWTILSNSTVESSISQDTTGFAEIFINGQNLSYIIISSPVISDAKYTDYIQFNFTIRKPNNVYWAAYIWDQKTKDQDFFPKYIKGWSLDEKSDTIIQNSMSDDPRQKVYAYFFLYGYGEFNITLRLSQISIVDHTESFTSEKCGRDEFRCLSSSSCIPFEFVGDGFDDCEDGNDERFTNTGDSLHCNEHQMECPWSGVCILSNASNVLKEQCKSNSSARPYEIQNTTCPNDFECKREFGLLDTDRAICLEENAVCDGLPNCPYWDDEVRCPIFCPPECIDCSYSTYKCHSNYVSKIPQTAMNIDLSEQNLNETALCTIRRVSLSSLNLSGCGLTDFSCVFDRNIFPSLKHLDVSKNKIEHSSIGGWDMNINLDENRIANLKVPTMLVGKLSLRNSNIVKVQWTYDKPRWGYLCINCNVTHIEDDYCPTCTLMLGVREFDFTGNSITNVRFINYDDFLVKINLSFNNISTFGERPYKSIYLQELYIHNNFLTVINSSVFHQMSALKIINLSWNLIDTIEASSFQTLEKLRILDLSHNRLQTLDVSTFYNLKRLHSLSLQGNILENLPSSLFKDLVELKTLNMSGNNLIFLKNDLFEGLLSLQYLDLRGNNIETYERIFDRLGVLQHLFVHDFSLCCARPKSVSPANCKAPSTIVSSCSNLVGSGFLRVYIWLIASIVFFGNNLSIYSYLRNRETTTSLLINYSFADLFLSIYLIIVAYKDVESRGRYGYEDQKWRKSNLCDASDILYSISLEATTMVVLLLLVENQLSRRLHRVEEIFLSGFVWLFSVCTSAVPRLTRMHYISKLGLCLYLPISTFLKENHYSESLVLQHLLVNALISIAAILVKLLQFLRERNKRYWLSTRGAAYNKSLNDLALVVLIRNCFIYVTGYLVIYDIDVIGYDWIVLFLLPFCSVLSVFVRSRFRHDEDKGVQINKVFDVRNPTENGGTLIIMMNVDKENVCSNFKDIGVLITNTESEEVYTSFCVRIVRNVIVADFTEGLDTIGHRKALDVTVHEGKRRLVYRYSG